VLFDVLNAYKPQNFSKILPSKDGSMKMQKKYCFKKKKNQQFGEKNIKLMFFSLNYLFHFQKKKKCCLFIDPSLEDNFSVNFVLHNHLPVRHQTKKKSKVVKLFSSRKKKQFNLSVSHRD
jgi:hypothetical protein